MVAASPEAIATVAKVLALGLTTPRLAKAYLGDDDEALELAEALASREPASVADADAAKLTSVARNLLTLGLTDRDTLAAGLADHPEADTIAETALALAGLAAHRAPERELTPLEAAYSIPARHRSPEQRQMVADADTKIMEAAAKVMNVTLDAHGRPISAAACTAGRHVWGEPDHRGWSTCAACGVVNVVNRLLPPGPIYEDHDSDAVVQASQSGRSFNHITQDA